MTERLAPLSEKLMAISSAYTGTCTWALTDLADGAHIGHNEDAVMPAASLIKVPVLVTLYRAVADGELALDDRIKYEERHRSLGSGVLTRMSFGVEMSVRDAATLMIIISDNSATNICVDLVSLDAINGLMAQLGLSNTKVLRRWGEPGRVKDQRDLNHTTAGDMARLLALVANHSCISPDSDEDMLRILRRQDYRHELSAELPWNELNMLGDDPKLAWVAEKGGASLDGWPWQSWSTTLLRRTPRCAR